MISNSGFKLLKTPMIPGCRTHGAPTASKQKRHVTAAILNMLTNIVAHRSALARRATEGAVDFFERFSAPLLLRLTAPLLLRLRAP